MIASSLPRIVLLVLAFTLAACQSYPLGMSKAEWERLTPAQQLEHAPSRPS